MRNILIAIFIAFATVGCMDITGDTMDSSVDNSVDNSITDSNVTYAHDGTDPVDGTTPDMDTYDEGLSQIECNDLGFFYCTIENKCLPQSNDTGTCTL